MVARPPLRMELGVEHALLRWIELGVEGLDRLGALKHSGPTQLRHGQHSVQTLRRIQLFELAAHGLSVTIADARFAKPLDAAAIEFYAKAADVLVTLEDHALVGGFGSAVLELLADERITGLKVKRIGIPDRFIEQGSQAQLRKDLGLDATGIAATVEAFLATKEKSTPTLARVK